MRYCSLPTRAYDILHYGLVFLTVLSPVFTRGETAITLSNIMINTTVLNW